MTKTFVAHTCELDDFEVALSDLKKGLNLDKLLSNSIGIISCHYEFIESGLVKEVCDALPFDIAGTISSPVAVNDMQGELCMTIMLITSDELSFEVVLTPKLDNPKDVVTKSFNQATQKYKNQQPGLIFAFAPFMAQNSGDDYINIITEVSNGTPCFGTLAVDDTADFSNCFMIHNGNAYMNQMSMVLVYGNIKPRFYVANISENKVLSKSAVITKSEGHIIKEVNGKTVDEFFEDLGLTKASETGYAMASLPFLLDYNDGTPKVSKIFITLTPERYALCAGAVPQGSTLYIASSDKSDVLSTTKEVTQQMLNDMQDASGVLIYSCISRSMTLGAEQLDEMKLVDDKLANKLPYMMTYSGGEICPTVVSNNKATNRFHNNAFIACLF